MRDMHIPVVFITLIWLTSLVGCAGSDPYQSQTENVDITFNESTLATSLDNRHNVVQGALSASFDEPRSILRYVMSHAPMRPVVYPTERYYYYTFPLASRIVSGNIRFVDADDGSISIGYFDAYNTSDMQTRQFHDGQDGVSITTDVSGQEIQLEIDGISRTFILDQSAFEQPSFDLLPGEQFISGIRDESGYYLYLMYWPQDRAFYYLLNPSKPIPERWIRGGGDELDVWFGEDSRFCFVYIPRFDRHILVGVHAREIMNNTMFDGPFDQVPPNLFIRELLEEAYPYVIDAGGIDNHGNFLKMDGQRIAISPYQSYTSGKRLEIDLQRLIDPNELTPKAWTNAVYESKKNWMPPDQIKDLKGHKSNISIAWPPNHWGSSSRTWSQEHRALTSTKWPSNHQPATSKHKDSPG